jgi:hypothetical protein
MDTYNYQNADLQEVDLGENSSSLLSVWMKKNLNTKIISRTGCDFLKRTISSVMDKREIS